MQMKQKADSADGYQLSHRVWHAPGAHSERAHKFTEDKTGGDLVWG